METKETYYEILGIDANSTEDDIRKAYRKQALLWHPDKNVHRKEEAEARFKLVAEAYEVLSDTEKRRIYDLYGEEGLKNGGPSYDSEPHFSFQAHDPFEIFNAFFGRDPFAGFGPPPFGFPPFGARPSGTGRSLFDNDPFFSSNFGGNFGGNLGGNFGGNFGNNFGSNFGGNFGGSSTSTFSFSSNSSFSGGGQGGYMKKSTTTQIVNGVIKTVTTTEDAQGNVTVVTETSDGERQVLVNNRPQALNDAPRNVMAIQDEVPYYQQQQQSQQPQRQQRQQRQQHYYQQQQYQEPPSYQYQETQQYQESEPQHQSQEDHSHHKKHFWQFKRK